MRHFILISHGYLAKGMADSVKMVLGEREELSYFCAYVDGNNEVRKEISKRIESFGEEAETVILTDIFGGSVNNELLSLMERKNVYLVSGMNLALVMALLVRAEEKGETEAVIEACVEEAKDNMKFCNKAFSGGSEEASLDEF